MCRSSSYQSQRLDGFDRSAAVAAIADQIANVDRDYPVEPSLYYTKMSAQLKEISLFTNPVQKNISAALAAAGPYNTTETFAAGYEALEKAGLIEIPQALDNSDEMFGEMRLGVKGHNSSSATEQCGAPNITRATENHRVFVEDFSAVGQFTDTNKSSSKYTPRVLGFFCNHAKRGLVLPLAIKLIDTGLTYTKKASGNWPKWRWIRRSSNVSLRVDALDVHSDPSRNDSKYG